MRAGRWGLLGLLALVWAGCAKRPGGVGAPDAGQASPPDAGQPPDAGAPAPGPDAGPLCRFAPWFLPLPAGVYLDAVAAGPGQTLALVGELNQPWPLPDGGQLTPANGAWWEFVALARPDGRVQVRWLADRTLSRPEPAFDPGGGLWVYAEPASFILLPGSPEAAQVADGPLLLRFDEGLGLSGRLAYREGAFPEALLPTGGSVVVAGGPAPGAWVSELALDGGRLWTRQSGGTAGAAVAVRLSPDGDGVAVCGTFGFRHLSDSTLTWPRADGGEVSVVSTAGDDDLAGDAFVLRLDRQGLARTGGRILSFSNDYHRECHLDPGPEGLEVLLGPAFGNASWLDADGGGPALLEGWSRGVLAEDGAWLHPELLARAEPGENAAPFAGHAGGWATSVGSGRLLFGDGGQADAGSVVWFGAEGGRVLGQIEAPASGGHRVLPLGGGALAIVLEQDAQGVWLGGARVAAPGAGVVFACLPP